LTPDGERVLAARRQRKARTAGNDNYDDDNINADCDDSGGCKVEEEEVERFERRLGSSAGINLMKLHFGQKVLGQILSW
jgi:hypothetical protein